MGNRKRKNQNVLILEFDNCKMVGESEIKLSSIHKSKGFEIKKVCIFVETEDGSTRLVIEPLSGDSLFVNPKKLVTYGFVSEYLNSVYDSVWKHKELSESLVNDDMNYTVTNFTVH